jgi:catechol 2,3-dioxygenase-like lactoylglutathione lyase family enzyme
MRFNNILPELYVIDFQKSLHFYIDILGFKLEYQRTNPLFAFLSYQSSQLMIQQEDNDEEWHNGKPEYPYGRGVKDNWYKVKDMLHGCREILVMDPSGYLLRFSQGLGIKKA